MKVYHSGSHRAIDDFEPSEVVAIMASREREYGAVLDVLICKRARSELVFVSMPEEEPRLQME
jgi:hypothetical protein